MSVLGSLLATIHATGRPITAALWARLLRDIVDRWHEALPQLATVLLPALLKSFPPVGEKAHIGLVAESAAALELLALEVSEDDEAEDDDRDAVAHAFVALAGTVRTLGRADLAYNLASIATFRLQATNEKGPHRCNPLIYWRARQESNPRPPGS